MSELVARARSLLAELQGQLTQRFGSEAISADRMKLYAAAVAAIILLSAYLGLSQAVTHARQTYRTAQIAYARLKAQVDSGSWNEKRAASQALKLTLEERFWVANTPGLAEAGFERWLREHLARYNVAPQQIQVRRVPVASADSTAKGPLAGMERMSAKILMPFDQTGLMGFLDDIAESEKAVVVDRLIVRSGRNARVELDVATFFPTREKSR
jgi:hypothetical protein